MGTTKKARLLAKYQQCAQAAGRGDLTELLGLAADPTLTGEMLATIAPGNRERDADVELVHAILDHPSCSEGIASRYMTHRDPAIRLRIATFPSVTGASLEILAVDTDQRVRDAATAQLERLNSTRTTRDWR
ncbi:hypothetical protein APR04_003887 [Promicromonospora umidemergens]|uniref:HEAT repeat protein n=2 Tax=Promicromonospora TaxID=43676 RepID=A0ABP8XH65_9MICO|nr:hypothetical protein [Promicromonospora umidemergens]MCP2284964.1 hypothetical protein [Promicromonospora umidemergens]